MDKKLKLLPQNIQKIDIVDKKCQKEYKVESFRKFFRKKDFYGNRFRIAHKVFWNGNIDFKKIHVTNFTRGYSRFSKNVTYGSKNGISLIDKCTYVYDGLIIHNNISKIMVKYKFSKCFRPKFFEHLYFLPFWVEKWPRQNIFNFEV